MNLRSDHVAGAAYVAFGALIIALSGDLPTGQLSMPGSGFMPKIVATLTILFGAVLIVRANESPLFSSLGWSDLPHAVQVVIITAAATGLYTVLGFILTMFAMMLTLLLVVERRNILRAAAYSAAMVLITYGVFVYLLKSPLPEFPFFY